MMPESESAGISFAKNKSATSHMPQRALNVLLKRYNATGAYWRRKISSKFWWQRSLRQFNQPLQSAQRRTVEQAVNAARTKVQLEGA